MKNIIGKEIKQMSHSNSSLNSFTACMAKYEHCYVKHAQPCKPPSPHLTFGTMAHEVLYKAGKLRDEVAEGLVLDMSEYRQVIPSEILYHDLKQEFQIDNWQEYFTAVIKETAKIENDCIRNLIETTGDPVRIEREVKLSVEPVKMAELGVTGLEQPFVGIVDLLIMSSDHAVILDYKFSSSRKTQDDFDMNSQLPLYAFFVHCLYDIPMHNIQYGYIDIPKKSFGKPTLLSNGTLSRSKDQNVSQELYEKAVTAIHGDDDPKYNCKPGGYYYDAWCNMALNKPAYLSMQYLDFEVVENVCDDLFKTAQMIDRMIREKEPFLRKFDSYSCKSCEYLPSCKSWLTVGGE